MKQTQTSLSRREKALQAKGITLRLAHPDEQTTDDYGNTLRWVVDLGGHRQAHKAYMTRLEALKAAETSGDDLDSSRGHERGMGTA